MVKLCHPFWVKVYPTLTLGDEFIWGRQVRDLVNLSGINDYLNLTGKPCQLIVTRNDEVGVQLLVAQLN